MKRLFMMLLLFMCCLLLTGCGDLIHIEGDSMAPTLLDDDYVQVAPYASPADIARFDVIILHHPRQDWLTCKRVIGLPGDTVQIVDGVLVVNMLRQSEPYLAAGNGSRENYGPVTVPAGHLFVLGDNRSYSLDSRAEAFGMVPLENVVSRVTEVVHPDPRPVE